MANARTYLNHLLQSSGITPACSEEERAAAEVISQLFSDHGFKPEVQEFTSSASSKVALAVMEIVLFISAILMGIGGFLGVLGVIFALAVGILYLLQRMGRISLPQFGSGGLSQNVIAFHKASGPLASPRNRPVVVVAHYDSPRAELLSQEPFAAYRPIITKLTPVAMVLPGVVAILRLFPLPGAVKVLLWIVAIVFSLVPLLRAVSTITNRFVFPYTSGAVCNKSSVAAMLGVMDSVAPAKNENAFAHDVPFDQYMAEQRRRMNEAYGFEGEPMSVQQETLEYSDQAVTAVPDPIAAPEQVQGEDVSQNQAVAEEEELQASVEEDRDPFAYYGDENVEDEQHASEVVESAESEEPLAGPSREDEEPMAAVDATPRAPEADEQPSMPVLPMNKEGNLRFGAAAIHALGMVSEDCVLEYEDDNDSDEDVAPTDIETADADQNAADAPVIERPAVVPIAVAAPFPEGVAGEEPVHEEEALPLKPLADASVTTVSEPLSDEQLVVPNDDIASQMARPVADDSHSEVSVDEVREQEAYVAPAPQSEPVLTGIEDFEEIIPEADMEIVPAEFEILEPAPEPIAEEPAAEAQQADAQGASTAPDQTIAAPALGDQSETEKTIPAEIKTDEVSGTIAFVPQQQDGTEADVESSSSPSATSTQIFEMPAPASEPANDDVEPESEPEPPVDTVDSLMAQISARVSAPRPKRDIAVPSVKDPAPSSTMQIPPVTPVVPVSQPNRSSLFDLPDPSARPIDPFESVSAAPAQAPVQQKQEKPSASTTGFTVISSDSALVSAEPIGTIHAPKPEAPKKRRGLFGRKKKQEDSMSDWLGVDEDFDAKRSGRDIGSWDNFDGDDGWKGGAAGEGSEDELRQAAASLGDDELLGHDIWFVATGSSENDNAGMRAFLDSHRDKLRGVFIINLECVGAGQLAVLSVEGEDRPLKGDRRITGLISRVSSDFHRPIGAVEMPYVDTDAHVAQERSLRAATLAGIDGNRFACSHTEEDVPVNLNSDNVTFAADVVTEVIRRS